MGRLILTAMIFILTYDCASGLGLWLELFRPFGYYRDTVSYPASEAMMLSKIDSMHAAETAGTFACNPTVDYRAYFEDLPCIAFYYLDVCVYYSGPPYPYQEVLYNLCNGSIYRCGGDIVNFSSVFREELASNYRSDFILELLRLYLNTLYTGAEYNILKTGQDFVAIYDELYPLSARSQYSERQRQKIAREIESVPDSVKALHWIRLDDCYRLEFYTFGGLKNSLERWVFDVYPDSLKIVERQIILERLGIYWRLH